MMLLLLSCISLSLSVSFFLHFYRACFFRSKESTHKTESMLAVQIRVTAETVRIGSILTEVFLNSAYH